MSDPTRSERSTRTPAFHGFRKATEVSDFPYASTRVCYLEMFEGELYAVKHYADDRREAARRAVAGESQLIAIWPGQYRSDAFLVDEPALFARAVGA